MFGMTTFPDQEFLQQLVEHHRRKALSVVDAESEMLLWSGVSMNWIADFLTDESARWEKREIKIDNLYLTGTNPSWNKVIIDQANRSPVKLRQILQAQPELRSLFSEAKFHVLPILIRIDKGKMKVFDGMHRTIGAILADRKTMTAFICTTHGSARPHCEPHVVYDILRSHIRKINQDRPGLIAALRYLRHSYANVDDLLRNRFNHDWVPDDEIQKIIQEALSD